MGVAIPELNVDHPSFGGRLPVRDYAWVESMVVRVLGFDCVHVGDFEVGSYTVFADGTLRLDLADGAEKTLDWEEWIDIRQNRDRRRVGHEESEAGASGVASR